MRTRKWGFFFFDGRQVKMERNQLGRGRDMKETRWLVLLSGS